MEMFKARYYLIRMILRSDASNAEKMESLHFFANLMDECDNKQPQPAKESNGS